MTTERIQSWLSYWNAAKMVAIDEILAFEHVYQARRFCKCMRVGVFANISDLSIWRAICSMRGVAQHDAHVKTRSSEPPFLYDGLSP